MRAVTIFGSTARAKALGVLAAVAVLAPMVWALSARVPNLVETPLTPDAAGRIAVPIELSYMSYPGSAGAHVARIHLSLRNLEQLVHRRSVEILVANYQTTPLLDSAELSVAGSECRFRTIARSEWPNNATLAFVRQRGCDPLQGTPTGQLELEVRFTGPGRVGVWTYRPKAEPSDADVIYLRDPSWSDLGLQVELRGTYVDRAGRSPYRRADLLAYMWSGSTNSLWIWLAVAAGTALLVLGGLAVPWGSHTAPGDRRLLKAVWAGWLCTAGLSVLYAVVVPPFQAPDEPSHFLGYANAAGNPAVFDAAARWSWATHFERLRGHPEERFRPPDVGQPHLVSWQLVSPVSGARSSVSVPLWRWIGGPLRHLSAPRQLIILRLINAFVFSLAIAACVALIGMLTTAKRPEAAIALLLLVPTLPFFATYVSNHAPGVVAYALVATGCLILFLDGPRAHIGGVPLGLGLALAIASTRSALPMVVMGAIVAATHALLGSREKRLASAVIFWGGLGAGALALWEWHTDSYASGLLSDIGRTAPRIGWIAAFMASHPELTAAAGVTGVVCLAWMAATARRGMGVAGRALVMRAAGPVCVSGMLAVAACLVASIFVRLPHLEPAAGASPALVTTYAMQALAAAATPFRFRDPDFLMSTTFWGAFGWVDTILPNGVLLLLSLSTAAATIVMLRGLWVARDARRLCWLAALTAGFFATVGVYAVAVFWSAPDLHGRYLIGVYLIALLIAWSPALRADGGVPTSRAAADWIAATAWLVLIVGHAAGLLTIVTRYF